MIKLGETKIAGPLKAVAFYGAFWHDHALTNKSHGHG